MADINATVAQHRDIITYMLEAHTCTHWLRYSGDTVVGIGKAVALREVTAAAHALSHVGDTSRVLSKITAHATLVILASCGQTKCLSLTGHAR